LFLLVQLAKWTGWPFTIAITIVTGVLGATIASRQRLSAFRRIADDLRAGRVPAAAILDVVMIVVAGLLLMTPGLLTDLLGAALLVPVCRAQVRRWAVRWMQKNLRGRVTISGYSSGFPADSWELRDEIIDSHVSDPSARRPIEDHRP
jgi:UPF0716 protein FxsA